MTKFLKLFDRLEKNFHLGQATITIAALTLLSRVFGFLRDLLLASKLGLSTQTDIYFTAFRIPDLVYNLLILGTLSAAFIPVFTSYYIKDKASAWRIASGILNTAILFMGVTCLVIFLFAQPLTKFVAPGFEGETLKTTITLTRILLLSPLIFTISSVLSSTLLSLKKFIWVNTAPLFYNLGIVIGILFFYPIWGISGLAFGVILGAVMHALIQLPQAIISGFRWRPVLMWSHEGVRQIIKLFLPRILGLDISYVNLVIVSIIGSSLATGTISAFNFATNIQTVPLGIFALSTALAVFPLLSEQYAKGQHKQFLDTFNRAFIRILYFILPASILLLLLRAHLVRLLIGYGKCDWSCTITTFDTLSVLSFCLIAQSLIPLISRAFYARHNTRTPVLIGLLAIFINGVLSYYLSTTMGIIGIAIGFLVASIVQAVALLFFLQKSLVQHKAEDESLKHGNHQVITSVSKIVLACILTGISAYGSLFTVDKFLNTRTVAGIFVQALFALIVASLVYLFTTARLGLPDAAGVRRYMDKMGKFFNVSNYQ